MKSSNKSRFRSLGLTSLLAICAAFSVASIAHASTRVESLREEVRLVSGTATPTLGGDASLEAVDISGTASGTLELSPEGLASGTYNVTATLKTGTDVVVLGSFSVTASGTAVATGTDSSVFMDDDGDDVVFGGTDGIPFPQNFNPFNLATVTISGTDDVAIMTADFTNPADIERAKLHVNIFGIPGVAAPTAFGHLVMNAHLHKRKLEALFNLVAHNLPSKTTLSLNLNGVAVGTVTTDRRGNLHLMGGHGHGKHHLLPSTVTPFDIQSVTLSYPNGGQDVLDLDL